jgi:hypothetical protein
MDQTDQAIERSKAVCFPCYAFPICFSALLEQNLQDTSCRLYHKLLRLEHKLLQH